ncbi:FGGY-family carbohydrate kinase [Psychromarinibacter sp. S121]|uniref:FGGY-family carbohydrate kinase n=1 Tax=Psychromarinibacter sp. S121 TaxID=3415127 RepID=UPI003C799848
MATQQAILVGIDIGTTNVKAVAIDTAGRVLGVHRRPMVIRSPAPGATEFDLDALSAALLDLLKDTVAGLEAAGHGPDRIAAISVAAIGESFVGLDEDDRPVLPCPTWYDRRTAPFRSGTGLSAEVWFDTTGMVDDDIYTIWRMIWWQREDPDAFARTRRWFSVSDYALFRLGGAHVANPSLAARTGLTDRHRLDWSDDHLRIAGVSRDAMPRILPQASVAGQMSDEVAAATGLPRATALVNAGHDHPCAGFGSGMTTPGRFVNSAGTAESLITLVDAPLDHAGTGGGEYDCYPHAVPGQFLLSGHIPTSGAAIDWMAARLGGAGDDAAAAAPPGARGVRVAPYLQGSGSPWNRRDLRMRIDGIDVGTGGGDLIRATYEGLSAWLSISVQRFVDQTGHDPTELLLTGGGSRHVTYGRIKAALLDRTLVVADVPEAAGVGAALVGGLAIGLWDTAYQVVPQGAADVHRIDPDPVLRAAYADLRHELQDFVTP